MICIIYNLHSFCHRTRNAFVFTALTTINELLELRLVSICLVNVLKALYHPVGVILFTHPLWSFNAQR
ncbi:uncharacterized protein EI90DRAFT_3036500 [Cantharellus anzutake]|uniref:uncharacterized protein n=1 Tax=Cantharellus anzutake TaxID=1750568 RepID=UPI001905EE0A|nr:uncharacterized protein EI90DRAFT_3036500 [Cantharellus anzutake]KAF8340692.1 hypothetical protein EI90DRAFT_3036500 [Cantharellus anzutake]